MNNYNSVDLNSSSSERLNASFQTLSDIKQAFLTNDIALISEKILVLIRQSNTQTNSSLLDMYLIQCLSIQDIQLQIRALKAISLLIPHDSFALSFLPGLIIPLLNSPELVTHALRCIIEVLTPINFAKLLPTLSNLSVEGPPIVRRLCLIVYFRAYIMDKDNAHILIEQLQRALFDPEMCENALCVATEVAERSPELIEPLLILLLPLIHSTKFVYFTKLLKIFSYFIDDKAIASQIEGEIIHRIENNFDVKCLIEVARFLIKMKSPALMQEVKKILDRVIPLISNTAYQLEIVQILVQLSPQLTISDAALQSLLSSQDYNVWSTALILKGNITLTDDAVKLGNSLVAQLISTPTLELATTIMKVAPRQGKWFVEIIFDIYNMHIEATLDALAKAISEVTALDTKKLIIAKAKDTMKELPDDMFGLSIAEMIAGVSDNIDDFFILVPSNISYKIPEFQAAMIGCAFELWTRLNFKIDDTMMSRLTLMSYSNYREVRNRSIELITLIKSQTM